jgi:hypothetical protein
MGVVVTEFDSPAEPDREPDEEPSDYFDEPDDDVDADLYPESPHPINWNLLTSDEVRAEWLELNGWVNWLRRTYGLPAAVIPPFWYRHPELVWELSALHLHWLSAYDPEQHGSAPNAWHKDFADARERLREWVALSGTKLDRDRPTRQTIWPGEEPDPDTGETVIENRDRDFVAFVNADIARRRAEEDAAAEDMLTNFVFRSGVPESHPESVNCSGR